MMSRDIVEDGSAGSVPVTDTRSNHGGTKPGLVMLCDVDLGFPDATRTHTVEVARGFARAGLDVDLVARGPDQHVDGVRYTRARGDEHQRLIRLSTINARTVRILWKRRRTAQRFYVREKWACMPSLIAARLLGYRVVTQVDSFSYGGPGVPVIGGYVMRVLAIVMGRLSHGILAVTPELRQLLIDFAWVPSRRVVVVRNGVDIEFFTPIARDEAIARAGLDPTCRYVVFCGGFHEWSDFDTLLRAFATVVTERPDARLLLVGDGPERVRILRLRQELGLEDVSIMTGLVHERTRVRDYLAASTVALLPYRADLVTYTSASPVKLNEYMASGRAVVAVEIPGVREYLEDQGAGVVVPGDPKVVAEAIIGLLDPERADRLGAAARRFAEKRLSWQRVVEQTLPLFGI